MTPAEQQRILRRLVEQGLIDETEVPSAESDGDELLDPLEQLVRRGLVDAAVVEAAARDLSRSAPSAAEPAQRAGGEPVEDELLVTGPAAVPPEKAASGSVPRELAAWDRYHVQRILGQGGSGTVYEAHDPRLDRAVALKVLASSEAFALREARMQARVAHPGVCQVHEVGWLGERPYIAMQLVRGETLRSAAKGMTREELVCAVRDAAEAVHAAHAIGLVHRDLKPGNLMIERAAERGLQCYVLDFGLAREARGPGNTLTGGVLGTPAYMAPEQARGEVRKLDRRTDVYGLGATLYDVLGGAPPFSGDAVSVLHAVLFDDPVPLRAREPSVALDLDTIVMKCLEKDPARRYDSARVLAEDLTAYLSGEPIRARRTSFAYWLYRLARRHRALAAVSAAGLLSAAALGTGWARSRAAARAEAEEARRFGQEAEAIETAARLVYLAPLHDTRPDRERLRERIRALTARMTGLRGGALAAGHEAAGRGALSLQAHEEARAHLDAAWSEGSRTPETAHARARTYAALYDESLEAARRLRDPAVRAERIERLQKELRAPALESLAEALRGDSERRALALGWIDHYEGRHDQAISRAEEGRGRRPWDHDAHLLAGDAHRAAGREEETRGNYEAAIARFARAADAYAEAAAIGRSFAPAHESECAARSLGIQIHVDSLRRPVDEASFEQAIAACDRALVADGDRPEAAEQKAHLLQLRAVQHLQKGAPAAADLDLAIALSEDVTIAHPERAYAHATLGLGLYQRAVYYSSSGIDARPVLAAAIDASERATEIDPELVMAQNNLGVLYRMRADDELRRGEDPRASLDLAVLRYERAAELDPEFQGVWNNIGRALSLKAEYELRRGLPAAASLQAALVALRRSVEALPELPTVHNNLGGTLSLQAASVFFEGGDPGPLLAEADVSFGRALALNGSLATAWRNRADADLLRADFASKRGQATADLLAKADAEYREALRSNPRYAAAHRGLSAVQRLAAHDLLAKGGDASGAVLAARAALAEAAAIAPEDPDVVLARAATERLAAAHVAAEEARREPDRIRRAALAEAAAAAAASARAADPLMLWVPVAHAPAVP